MTTRRSILASLFAMPTVAATGKFLAGAEPVNQAYRHVSTAVPSYSSVPGSLAPEGLTGRAAKALIENTPGMMDMLRKMVEERFQDIVHINTFDSDLEANRSMSKSAKRIIMRRRLIERELEKVLDVEPAQYWMVEKTFRALGIEFGGYDRPLRRDYKCDDDNQDLW